MYFRSSRQKRSLEKEEEKEAEAIGFAGEKEVY
jgi:hypothetical protein